MKPKSFLIDYPWTNFLAGRESFDLFGYGSLVNEYSSQNAIRHSSELVPAIAFSVRRIMNYDPNESVRSRTIYQDPERGDEYFGVFNIEFTGNSQDMTNGVIRRVEKSDFPSLIAREVGYSLLQIEYVSFNDREASLKEAFVLIAPEEFNGRKLVNNDLLPNVPYYKLCREGAASVSREFLNLWLNTSFLGDGRTVLEWEKEEGLF